MPAVPYLHMWFGTVLAIYLLFLILALGNRITVGHGAGSRIRRMYAQLISTRAEPALHFVPN